jgi:hypothetical protein
MKLALLIGILFVSLGAGAADQCLPKQAQAAEAATDNMKTWYAIYSGFKAFHYCDDGAIAEGFTEAVVHLLASDWNSVSRAASIARDDKTFHSFLLKHINASANTDELKAIASVSEERCPREASSMCRDIRRSAIQALQEAAP